MGLMRVASGGMRGDLGDSGGSGNSKWCRGRCRALVRVSVVPMACRRRPWHPNSGPLSLILCAARASLSDGCAHGRAPAADPPSSWVPGGTAERAGRAGRPRPPNRRPSCRPWRPPRRCRPLPRLVPSLAPTPPMPPLLPPLKAAPGAHPVRPACRSHHFHPCRPPSDRLFAADAHAHARTDTAP